MTNRRFLTKPDNICLMQLLLNLQLDHFSLIFRLIVWFVYLYLESVAFVLEHVGEDVLKFDHLGLEVNYLLFSYQLAIQVLQFLLLQNFDLAHLFFT